MKPCAGNTRNPQAIFTASVGNGKNLAELTVYLRTCCSAAHLLNQLGHQHGGAGHGNPPHIGTFSSH
jgi:hypothetical protein